MTYFYFNSIFRWLAISLQEEVRPRPLNLLLKDHRHTPQQTSDLLCLIEWLWNWKSFYLTFGPVRGGTVKIIYHYYYTFNPSPKFCEHSAALQTYWKWMQTSTLFLMWLFSVFRWILKHVVVQIIEWFLTVLFHKNSLHTNSLVWLLKLIKHCYSQKNKWLMSWKGRFVSQTFCLKALGHCFGILPKVYNVSATFNSKNPFPSFN